MANPDELQPLPLTAAGRYLILAAAFLGWMFSGVQMSLMNLAARSATMELARAGALDDSSALSWRRLVPGFEPRPASSAEDSDLERLVTAQKKCRWCLWVERW